MRSTSDAQTSHSGETDDAQIEGLIVDGSRGQYRVKTAEGIVVCTIRGRLRKQLIYPVSTNAHRHVKSVKVGEKDPVAVGDRVRLLPTGGGAGVIEAVVARAGGAFTRDDPDDGGGTLTTVAGLDQLVLVFAARDPEPHPRLLDRLLVLAEAQELVAVVCLNKVDLGVAPALAAPPMGAGWTSCARGWLGGSRRSSAPRGSARRAYSTRCSRSSASASARWALARTKAGTRRRARASSRSPVRLAATSRTPLASGLWRFGPARAGSSTAASVSSNPFSAPAA